MAMSTFISIAMFCVYAFMKDVRSDVGGKSEFCFLISWLVVSVSLPIFYINSLLIEAEHTNSLIFLILGFVLTNLWTSVLSFEIWWTTR